MNIVVKNIFMIGTIVPLLFCGVGCNTPEQQSKVQRSQAVDVALPAPKKRAIQIILGSTRQGRTADKIATALQQFVATRTDITTEIIDLRDYNLPFLNDEVPPARREIITDPIIKRWSDKITEADAFIMVVPEYNSGYPGVLKNALDSLYKEWASKPVAFVGYSGGPGGGVSAVAQLRTVAKTLGMIPVLSDLAIPSVWQAFDEKGVLVNKNIEKEFTAMIDHIIKAVK